MTTLLLKLPLLSLNKKLTFCMQMSAKIESGMVRLSASVPINDEVRKQPLLMGEVAIKKVII